MFRTYKYRLILKPSHRRRLETIREQQRLLYNAALQERLEAYRYGQRLAAARGETKPSAADNWRGITHFDQSKSLTTVRADDPAGIGSVPANLSRWTLRKLHFAFVAMFNRVKKREKAGFPRYRPYGRFRSFGFCEFSGVSFRDGRLRFKGCPALRVHRHRELPEQALIRSLTVGEDADGWFVSFDLKLDDVATLQSNDAIGVDVGVINAAALSDGTIFKGPGIGKRSRAKMRRIQRSLRRAKHASKQRAKAKSRLARHHRRIACARRTSAQQIASQIVRRAATRGTHIAIEDLSVRWMLSSAKGTTELPGRNVKQKQGLNRVIQDATMAGLLLCLTDKAESAGLRCIKVAARNTSQDCSECGTVVLKPRSARLHRCVHCGIVIDRDVNAARNIRDRALATLQEEFRSAA